MKIIDLKSVYVDQGPGPRPFSDGGYRDQKRVFGYVEVFTDDGLSGFCLGAAPPSLIEHDLKEVLVGQNPLEVERLWQRLFQGWRHPKMDDLMAISKVDTAVWDLMGRDPWDYTGCAEVARALDVPVATGENVSSLYAFRDMIGARACDIIQADPLYCGGITEWRKIAAYAAAHKLPMAPHGNAHVGAHCVGGASNGLIVEVGMYAGRQSDRPAMLAPLKVERGTIQLTDVPGFGSRSTATRSAGTWPTIAKKVSSFRARRTTLGSCAQSAKYPRERLCRFS
jgi:L-alanine-DL-glutamate epimerase-like enolase superfamily enzyme